MGEAGWTWRFRAPAKRAYDSLDAHEQDRITDKLDAIVSDEWRSPIEYLEPLSGAPHSKLRIGPFRLGAECDRDAKVLDVYTIERRGAAYQPGDS